MNDFFNRDLNDFLDRDNNLLLNDPININRLIYEIFSENGTFDDSLDLNLHRTLDVLNLFLNLIFIYFLFDYHVHVFLHGTFHRTFDDSLDRDRYDFLNRVDLLNRNYLFIDYFLFNDLGHFLPNFAFTIYGAFGNMLNRHINLSLNHNLLFPDHVDIFIHNSFIVHWLINDHFFNVLNRFIDQTFDLDLLFNNLFYVFRFLNDLLYLVIYDLFNWNLNHLLDDVISVDRAFDDSFNGTFYNILNRTLDQFFNLYIDRTLDNVPLTFADLFIYWLLENPDLCRQNSIIMLLSDIFFIDFYELFDINRVFDHYLTSFVHKDLMWHLDYSIDVNRTFDRLLHWDFHDFLYRDLNRLIDKLFHYNLGHHVLFYDLLDRAFDNHVIRHLNFSIHGYRLLNNHLNFFVNEFLIEDRLL